MERGVQITEGKLVMRPVEWSGGSDQGPVVEVEVGRGMQTRERLGWNPQALVGGPKGIGVLFRSPEEVTRQGPTIG